MRASDSDKPGFRPVQLMSFLVILLLGAGLIWYSLDTHTTVRSHVDVLNTRKPMNVLVGVQGTPLNPGFVGFVAEVKPNSHVLHVIPISGQTPVSAHTNQEPLYLAVSEAKPLQAMQLVERATGVPIDHYFYLSADNLIKLIDALYYHSPNWPKQRTPLTMLQTLGYPSGRIKPRQEMTLVRTMVTHLPLISPITASSLLSIPRTSLTNLTMYQLFLLANYVRGDQIRQGYPPGHALHGQSHG